MEIIGALGINLAILVLVMMVMWLISVKIRDPSFIDAFWAYGMAIMASSSIMQMENPGRLAWAIWALTAFWGIRLGTHLFLRWRREGIDPRYVKIMNKAVEKDGMSYAMGALVRVWALQLPLLFTVCLCAQLGILLADGADLGPIAIFGAATAITGILFETIGDMQLRSFRANPANKGKVLDTGLWRFTRHPNYFGDFCAWWGIWLVAAQVGWPVWAAIIGPIFLTFTLTKWSGKPLLEYALKKNRPGYVDYIERTSGFFPLPPKPPTA